MSPKLLAISYTIPTEASGTPVVIRRLLENASPNEVVLIGRRPRKRAARLAAPLRIKTKRIPTFRVGARGDRYWMIAGVFPALALGWWIVRKEGTEAIVSFFPDEGALLTGYWLSKVTKRPHVIYLCDLYRECPRPGWQERLARWLQPRAFAAASKIVVVNEAMARFYAEKYKIDAAIVPACINEPIPPRRIRGRQRSRMSIGFSGNVNDDRIGPLRLLTGLVADSPDYELRYFSEQGEEFLRANGLWASNVTVQLASDDKQLLSRLSDCDVLYLPLTFDADKKRRPQLETCFGIKAYDYLLSQTPILVHCPETYFTSQFFREHNCGLCVSSERREELETALLRLRSDKDLREELASNGLVAASKFRGESVFREFRAAIESVVNQDKAGGKKHGASASG